MPCSAAAGASADELKTLLPLAKAAQATPVMWLLWICATKQEISVILSALTGFVQTVNFNTPNSGGTCADGLLHCAHILRTWSNMSAQHIKHTYPLVNNYLFDLVDV